MSALPPGVGYDKGIDLAVTQRGWWAPPYTSCMLAAYCMVLAKQGYTLPLDRAKTAYDGTNPKVVNFVLALHRATGRPLSSGTTLQDTITAVKALWAPVSDPKPVIHVGAVGRHGIIDLLDQGATIRVSGGPLSAFPRLWNLPAGYGNARHAFALEGTRLSPTTGIRQVFLVDPMYRPASGYRGQWVAWAQLYHLIDKDSSGAVIATWGLPNESLVAPPPPPPDGGDKEQTPTSPTSAGDIVPAMKTYQPGYTTTINTKSNIRVAPDTSAKILRTTASTEAWTIVGTVIGDTVNGNNHWLVRWSNGAWEYTHVTNGSVPQAPPSRKAVTDALASSENTTKILKGA